MVRRSGMEVDSAFKDALRSLQDFFTHRVVGRTGCDLRGQITDGCLGLGICWIGLQLGGGRLKLNDRLAVLERLDGGVADHDDGDEKGGE